MFGRKVEDMRMAWIAQECPALHTLAQVLGDKGHLAPLSHHTADVQAPVGVEIIHHPVVTVHGWQLRDDIGQMGGGNRYWCGSGPEPARPDPSLQQTRQSMPVCHAECTRAHIFPVARCKRLRGVFSLQESASRSFHRCRGPNGPAQEP